MSLLVTLSSGLGMQCTDSLHTEQVGLQAVHALDVCSGGARPESLPH
jgi:hypothetical protein